MPGTMRANDRSSLQRKPYLQEASDPEKVANADENAGAKTETKARWNRTNRRKVEHRTVECKAAREGNRRVLKLYKGVPKSGKQLNRYKRKKTLAQFTGYGDRSFFPDLVTFRFGKT